MSDAPHQHTPAATASMPKPAERDPKMPRLAQSPGFVEHMKHGWSVPDRTPTVAPGIAQAAAAHRARLSRAFPGKRLVISAGRAPVRANDSYYLFRPDSDFFWLTGCDAEDAVVVLEPAGTGHDAVLYVPKPAYPGETDFHADPVHGELWVGAAPDAPDWAAVLDIETRLLPAPELCSGTLLWGTVPHSGPAANLATHPRSAELGRTLSELRMIKDEWEIAELRLAVDHSVTGFEAVVREIPNAMAFGGERWLQGTFDRVARTLGNGPGYSTIVGSGAHAPILHWVRCDGPVRESEALLLDMGVENRSFYTADVTRTVPTTGTFTEPQRRVHDLVEASHRAGLAAVGPGRPWSDFHVASMEVIANGLHDWGLLPVSVDEALSPDGQQHRRYLVCGVGHHLGLDVHDCAASSYAAYQGAELTAGMVLTVEPGLYFHAFDETVPPELRGIGVRLEDDVLVTASGSEVLSDALPIDAAGIEAWMRGL